MRKFKNSKLVFLLILLFSVTTMKAETNRQLCNILSNAGGLIMEKRQDGQRVAEVIESIELDEVSQRIMERITIAAFEKPVERAQWKKEEAIKEFEDEVYIMCLKNF